MLGVEVHFAITNLRIIQLNGVVPVVSKFRHDTTSIRHVAIMQFLIVSLPNSLRVIVKPAELPFYCQHARHCGPILSQKD